MLAILPLTAFTAVYFLFLGWLERRSLAVADWRETIPAAALAGGVFIALGSEILSLFSALTRPVLILLWGSALAAILLTGWRSGWLLAGAQSLRRQVGALRWRSMQGALAGPPVLFAGILLAVALIAPPNTNDALQYHLSRVMHWAQNGSLAHYATPVERQIWMPPFAEEAILHLNLLAVSDRLANLVQWGSMVCGLALVSLMAKKLGAAPTGQVFAALFAATIPMGVLQASSSQNDTVNTLWVLCLAYFAITLHQRRLSVWEWAGAGCAAGLGLLTKGTFTAFALPLLFWMLVAALRQHGWGWQGMLRFAGLGLVCVLFLNAGAWGRNLQTYSFPLGPRQGISDHANEMIGPGVVFVNSLRNLTLHLGTPWGVVNGPLRDGVTWIANIVGQDVNDPRTTLDAPYRVKRSFHEDFAGNPWHLLAAGISLALFWLHRKQVNASAWVYGIALVGAFLLFSALYKWQPTGSRLQLPLFVAWAPLAGLAFRLPRQRWPGIVAAILLSAAGLWPLLANPSRPILPTAEGVSLFSTTREELLLINAPEFFPGYRSITEAAGSLGCASIGLALDSSQPEYPFWAWLSPGGSEIHLEHLETVPALARYQDLTFRPCAVICTTCSAESYGDLPRHSVHFGGYTLYAKATSP